MGDWGAGWTGTCGWEWLPEFCKAWLAADWSGLIWAAAKLGLLPQLSQAGWTGLARTRYIFLFDKDLSSLDPRLFFPLWLIP